MPWAWGPRGLVGLDGLGVMVGQSGEGSIYQQILDPKQCSRRTTLPVGLKDRRRKMAVPIATAAYGQQLKSILFIQALGLRPRIEETVYLSIPSKVFSF